MPIMMAAWRVKSGMSTTLVASRTSATPQPMPNSAVRMGSPMASREPKAMSRMTTAASRPMTSLDGSCQVAKASPPSSIWRPGTWTSATYPLTCSAMVSYSETGRSARFTSA